jgi:uncharacterized membrane-anchored protein
MRSTFLAVATLVTSLFFAPASSSAQAPNPQIEWEAAIAAVKAAAQAGPADVPIAGQAVLKMPPEYSFIPKAQAAQFMKALGNRTGETFQGMVIDRLFGGDWFALVEYLPAGYIRDDDARDWKADKLLEDLRAGTEEQNADRRARGIEEIEVAGWLQTPTYDASNHRLTWSVASRKKGEQAAGNDTVNFKTLMLGREGYVSITLVTAKEDLPRDKLQAERLIGKLDFTEGKRYADFNASTDHVAEYGLAALVAGVAAKKVGFFAVAAALLLKFWKVLAIGAVAVSAGGFKKLFAKKQVPPSA